MKEHIVKSFDRDIRKLDEMMAEMGKDCEVQLTRVVELIEGVERDLAEEIQECEKELNACRAEIESYTVFLIAKRQPVAGDLRHVVSGFKSSSELERIGDYAAGISWRAMKLRNTELTEPLDKIIYMVGVAGEMLNGVMEALLSMDLERAVEVWHLDDKIDGCFSGLITRLGVMMEEDGNMVADCTMLIFMARCCERIGDHITNIAESINYIRTGSAAIRQR